MNKSNSRLLEYYTNGHYKGFYPSNSDRHYRFIGSEVFLTFTNGEDTLSASGKFREDALKKMLDTIDLYQMKNRKQMKLSG